MYLAYVKEKEAYIYLDNNRRWSLTRNTKIAYKTDTEEKLMSTIHSQMKYKDWEIEVRSDVEPQEEEIMEATSKEPQEETPVVHCGQWIPSERFSQILGAVQQLSSMVSTGRACELAGEISKLNKEVTDMEHYLEFTPMKDKEMIAFCRKFQSLLIHRRDVKQELELVNKILQSSGRTVTDGRSFVPVDAVKKVYTARGKGDIFKEVN